MPPSPIALVWFRDDLRLADNPALAAAAATGLPVLCLYVESHTRARGGAQGWWLSRSLKALSAALSRLGGRLDVCAGDPETIIPALAVAGGARLVTWNRRYGEEERELDARIKAALIGAGIEALSHNSHLLNEPWEVKSAQGGPLRVFSPYWRAAQQLPPTEEPTPPPARLRAAAWPPTAAPAPISIDGLKLEPSSPDWAARMRAEWTPGEEGAQARLDAFLDGGLAGYGENRNRPDLAATSMLSPHLRFGEISVRQIWHAAPLAQLSGRSAASPEDVRKLHSELGWREFSYHLLFHNPRLAWENHNRRFDAFPFIEDAAALRAWRRGRTGYPMVDAGMRQLWSIGWMHNRVRMIAASFLVKHCLIDWRRGEEWFWDTLVDADPANNAASWQWVAGCGADAAPYFRIFNPFLQGEKFDPRGDYVRRWCPELSRLPDSLIHRPWEATPVELARAGVRLGVDYPRPIIAHKEARVRALAALAAMKPVAD